MGDKNAEQSIMDKSMRSVFVGNIPYEATEEKLKEIFSEVGPVVSLKLVYDRESGKPKGYGFCEYKDQETALSAMRNLNGFEIGGRTLRVDNACTEKSRMEMQQLLQGPQIENPYGEHCDPDDAPEIITKTVASLPPEQMYELMKQMKLCIQNNPNEARQMLLSNPQLAYALLQAQVVMRIVDPQTALSMLFKSNQMPPVATNNNLNNLIQQFSQPQQQNISQATNSSLAQSNASSTLLNNIFTPPNQDIDLRSSVAVDPRISRNLDQDMRSVPNSMVPPPSANIMDVGFQRNQPPRPIQLHQQQQQQQQQQPPPPPPIMATFPSDPRQRPSDPRLRPTVPIQQQQQPIQQATQQQPPSTSSIAMPQQNRLPSVIPSDASDHEKAALIMQVLQLSDEQISMLPMEQRASIIVLKEQIAKSTQR